MNINLLRYQTNNNIKYYEDTLNSFNCRCILDKPARITNTNVTLIDHIYTKCIKILFPVPSFPFLSWNHCNRHF